MIVLRVPETDASVLGTVEKEDPENTFFPKAVQNCQTYRINIGWHDISQNKTIK